jgi:deoxyribonuclease V
VIPPELLDPPDFKAATAAQRALAALVEREDRLGTVRLLGGVDISSTRFDPERWVHAAVVVLAWPGLAVVARAGVSVRARLPYVPGYLGFREVPALRAAWGQLAEKPDLLLVDGHGVAHPRGFGMASHLGVVLDVPAIGCAKSLLVGTVAGPLGAEPGASAPLLHEGERLGIALRSRRRAGPLHVSAGHRVSLDTAEAWVRRCLAGYRLPEPTRQAHLAANALRISAARGA